MFPVSVIDEDWGGRNNDFPHCQFLFAGFCSPLCAKSKNGCELGQTFRANPSAPVTKSKTLATSTCCAASDYVQFVPERLAQPEESTPLTWQRTGSDFTPITVRQWQQPSIPGIQPRISPPRVDFSCIVDKMMLYNLARWCILLYTRILLLIVSHLYPLINAAVPKAWGLFQQQCHLLA